MQLNSTIRIGWLALCLLLTPSMAQQLNGQQPAKDPQADRLHQIDSLKQVQIDDVTKQLKVYSKIIRLYRFINVDSSLVYSTKEMELAATSDNPDLLAIARLNRTSILGQTGKDSLSIPLLLANKEQFALIHDSLIAHTESNLSRAYFGIKAYDQALVAARKAAEGYERVKDSSRVGFCNLTMATIYSEALEDYDAARGCLDRAQIFFQSKRTPKNNLVITQLLYGDYDQITEDYDQALVRYKEAQRLALEHQAMAYFPAILWSLGKVHYYRKEHSTSIDYLEQALARSAYTQITTIRSHKYLGLNYKDLGQPKKAIAHFEECLQLDKRLTTSIDYKKYLIDCYRQLADFQRAFELQEEVITLQDSFNEVDRREKLAEIVEGYENEKKQLEIDHLNAENLQKADLLDQQQITFWIVVAVLLVLGAAGFFFLRFRTRWKEGVANLERARLQQRFLRVQLNPHFFFHALSSIEGYIYANEKKSAASFLRNFSHLMRHILESSDRDFIPLKDDIRMIRDYITLQQMNSDSGFDFNITVAEGLEDSTIGIPPMLIQPFVENAILHGALQASAGKVEVIYETSELGLQITVKDNGPGHDTPRRESDTLHRSMSMDIVRERIDNLKEVHGIDIHYSIASPDANSPGTAVTFQIPTPMAQVA